MDNLTKLHKTELLIASEVDRICKKNAINYSLVGGSLIGAIRHKGFIPWDDDMDISMLRSDYEKFVNACRQDLDDRFFLQTTQTDPFYYNGFSKVILNNTELVEPGQEKTKCKKGIYIDIFPLDNIADDSKSAQKQGRINYFLVKLLERKAHSSLGNLKFGKKKVAFFFLDLLSYIVPSRFLVNKLINNMTKYNSVETKRVCSFGGYYGYQKETTKREYFQNVHNHKFENHDFLISDSYDEFLRSMFGDYMILPPEEERHTHEFQKLNFGPYEMI